MKIITDKIKLEESLTAGSRFISTKLSTVQSLQGGRLIVKDKKIYIQTTNLNDFFQTIIEGTIKEDGDIIFDIKKAVEFLSLLAPGDIHMETKDNEVIIQQGKTTGRFRTSPIDEFPQKPDTKGKGTMLKKDQKEKILKILFSASRDESRPVLTGVYFLRKGKELHIVTTDGFRLSTLSIKDDFGLDGIIIPSSVLLEGIRLSKNENIEMLFSEKKKLVELSTGTYTITSRILEGDFPPYEKVIPSSSKTTTSFLKDDLIKNIKLISVFARDNADIVIFDMRKDGLYLRPKTGEGQSSEVFVEYNHFSGDETKIAFNFRYVLDFLNNANTEKIVLEFNQSTSPGLFREDKNKEYLHIIMPLRTDETS